MLSKLIGGILYDPAQKVNGELRDIFIRDGFIVCDPGQDAGFDEIYDVTGKVVMADGNVNTARQLLPVNALDVHQQMADIPIPENVTLNDVDFIQPDQERFVMHDCRC